ncbi:MAG: chromosome segregation protein SMC [bacterium]
MFLKKVKIKGFKSFAKPVVIEFNSPMTAIVGPNGSGKSNVVDAIRWAMGEQSAKSLRGSRMADVIFAGSKDYSPQKKASVTLYINNKNNDLPLEAGEVKISRTVTDDGQSDYKLNGSTCRLKDIEELLMDTGMGKDSYSIVGQGKIDSILNSKPTKLRELFEEAASISKHKMRKENAEKRLDRTRHDLQRVKDLIWELDKQVEPMKKAAEKAKKYNRLHNELKELEVNLLLDKWNKNNDNLIKINKDKNLLENKLKRLERKSKKTNNELVNNKKKLENDIEQVEQINKDYYQAKIKKEQTENNLNVLHERKNGLHREKNNILEQVTDITNEKKKLSQKLQTNRGNIEEIKEKENGLNNKLEKINNKIDEYRQQSEGKKAALDSLRNSMIDGNLELSDLHKELEKYREKSRHIEMEIEKMRNKRKDTSAKIDNKIMEIDRLNKKVKEVNGKLNEYDNKLDKLKNYKKNYLKDLKELDEKKAQLNKKTNQVSSKLHVLKEMEDDYKGYFRGVRKVLKHKDKLSGIIGVVADKVKVDKKYETAVETALGAKLQNIIVKSDKDARNAVNFLKEIDGGRATFLPLDMVKGRKAKLDRYELEESGLLGIASEFVEVNEKLTKIIDNLLGRIIITDTLKTAVKVSKTIKNSLKIVTLDGDIINPGGAITGGSKTNNRGLLGRSRQIKELKNKKDEIQTDIQQLKVHRNKVNSKLEQVLKDIKETEEKINKNKFNINDLNKDIVNNKKEKNRLKLKLEKIDNEFVNYHKKLGENDNIKQKLAQEIDQMSNQHNKGKDEINNIEEEVSRLEDELIGIVKKKTDTKVQLATVKEQKNNLVDDKENIEIKLGNLQDKIEKNEKQVKSIEEKLTNISKRRVELEQLKKDFSCKIIELEKRLQKKQKSVKEMEAKVESLEKTADKFQSELNEVKDDYHKRELKITRLEDKNEQMEERLFEEYNIRAEDGINDRIEINNYSQISRKIKEFKDSIKKLGAVNHGAIEEYNELKLRVQHLKEQQQDLLTARESIKEIIKELEKKMSSLFYQTFTEVKEKFEEMFVKLFNGGMAELTLTRPEDLLETGVEIEAQPPGKQLKKLSLMSGGERALTAIALVFAFMQVNPSPIYILDEIDAPLDDANVMRFASFIKEYSQHVQFLLITHNKNMMAESSVIYGITMEEPGVSRIVSLELDEEIA